MTLLTDKGEVPFKIVGVVYDFDVRPGVMISDDIYRSYWDDSHLSSAALFVEPGVDVDEKIGALKAVFGGKLDLVIRSNRALRANALAVFDRTFSIFVALQLLAAVVAFIGVLSALMSLQLERTREIGTLRSIGITPRSIIKVNTPRNGADGCHRRINCDAYRSSSCGYSDIHHQPPLFWMDTADAVTTFTIYPCVCGCTCFRLVRGYLSRMAHGTDAACGGIENRVMGLEGKEDWKEGRESHTFSLQRGSKEWIMTAIEIFHVDRTRLYNRLAPPAERHPCRKTTSDFSAPAGRHPETCVILIPRLTRNR